MNDDDVVALLADTWPEATIGQPVPLTGGFWASMWRLPVSGQPGDVAPEVVVRFAPSAVMGAKESAVQEALAVAGFATPLVWMSRPAGDDGWWSIMDFSTGAPLLAGLDGIAALRRAPALLKTLPAQLASAMVALHRVDPGSVTEAVAAAAPDAVWSVDDLVDHIAVGATAAGRSDVGRAIDRLRAAPPSSVPGVVCHGDLHPFNVLADGETPVVLDWTGAVVADPCFDLAFTELLLANPPLQLPRVLAPIGRAAGRLLARRFVSRYITADPTVSLAAMDWFRAVHCARVLVDVTNLRAAHGPNAGGHPWATVAPAAARHLTATTDVEVQP